MGMKLFKRKSKKASNDDQRENKTIGGSTKEGSDNDQILNDEAIPSGLTDESGSTSIDKREGLYEGIERSANSNEDHEENGKPKIISARDGAGKFKASQVRDSMLHQTPGYKSTRSMTVPSARESAYTGPPRYDWIDVEAAAAIKIQSIFRRHLVLAQLEKEGKSTAAMRNKIRSRHAQKKELNSEDVPTFMRFCGIGFLFADATGEDTTAINAEQTAKKDKKFMAKIEKEKSLRKFRMRQKSSVQYEEAVEVVDHVD